MTGVCGVSLIIDRALELAEVDRDLRAAAKLQLHRGPDDTGVLVQQLGGVVVGLGHQRLSINDLSARGHQPMVSPCGRYAITYNGEVYNYQELAEELRGDPILDISTGDTAVVLAAIARWGTEAFRRFNGMWALAFLDIEKNQLIVSRDRLGVKPLYWLFDGRRLVFSSEVKAILVISGRRFSVNRDIVGRYLVQSLTDTTAQTFFEGIEQTPAGSCAVIDLSQELKAPKFLPYWKHPFVSGAAECDDSLSSQELLALILDSVRIRLRSDVSVGILLSGGLDSSTIIAAAREAKTLKDIRALSVVSSDPSSSEEPYIDMVARHIGCEVTKIQIDLSPMDALDELDRVCWYSDQPVGGFSAVGHRMLMKSARDQKLTVLLTGQGSDEQLAGYNKYFYFCLLHKMRRGNLIGALALLCGALLQGTILREFSFEEAKRYLPRRLNGRQREHLGPALAGISFADTGMAGSIAEREYRDLTSLSVPMLLHYEDRMSMSYSREVRVPFLDYRIVEFLARVPVRNKLRGGWTKAILRDAIAGIVPDPIRWRRDKKGFNVPEKSWARGVFVERFKACFGDEMLAGKLGLVRPFAVRRLYDRYLAGDATVSYKEVFNVYCLERWLRVFADHIAA
jgi:asparagine synthase (glutamine-hydrolysing)